MYIIEKTDEFDKWLRKLKDLRAKVKILFRVQKIDAFIAAALDQRHAVARDAGRHHAIERVDAVAHGFENIFDAANAEEVHGAIVRQIRTRESENAVHFFVGAAKATTDGRAEERTACNILRGIDAEVFVDTALHHAVDRLFAVVRCVERMQ